MANESRNKELKKPITRKETEKAERHKQLDKERKRKYRAEWSNQKRLAYNKKCLERYHKKKQKINQRVIVKKVIVKKMRRLRKHPELK